MSANLNVGEKLERQIRNRIQKINNRFIMEIILKKEEGEFVEFEIQEWVGGGFYTNTIGKYHYSYRDEDGYRFKYIELEKGINAKLLEELDKVAEMEIKRRKENEKD